MPRRTRASGRALVTSSPASAIAPEVARTRPLRTPSNVDVPAPFAPPSAMSSAGAMSRSMPNSTGPASKPAVRPLTLSKGSGLEAFGIALAQGGLDHPLVRQHNLRLPIREHLAGLEHDRPAAHADDDAHDVLDQQHGHAG